MRINHQGSANIDRMYLAGGQYERDRLPNAQWRNLTYITTPKGLNAVFIQNEDNGEEGELFFIHTDYQGSIMALTDYNGQLVEEYSYDPWGNRRDPNTWQNNYTNTTNPGGTSILYRGYTFHEQLDCFALINLNGRMYDPVLGRMLSTDNNVQNGTQGLNRYAYVLNNPLVYVDPSGEIVLGLLRGLDPDGVNRRWNFRYNPLDINRSGTPGYVDYSNPTSRELLDDMWHVNATFWDKASWFYPLSFWITGFKNAHH